MVAVCLIDPLTVPAWLSYPASSVINTHMGLFPPS